MTSAPERRRDRGAVLVVVSLAVTALMIVVAIVIDHGSTRAVRRETRAAADAGATSGALGLIETTSVTACQDALAYTFLGIRGTQPTSSAISSACTVMAAACSETGAARTATLTVGNVTVRVVNPVPDANALMSATALAGRPSQAIDTNSDGTPCQRLGVEVTRPQSRYFGGIVSTGTESFTVHAVARFTLEARPGLIPPALVTLNQTACNSIDAGNNGTILLRNTASGPGIAYSDSNGPSCSTSNPILNAYNSGRIVAEGQGALPGQLGWYEAPTTRAWRVGSSTQVDMGTSSSTQNYVGQMLLRTGRTTRQPADEMYHCRNVPVTPATPLCLSTEDPVETNLAFATATSAPAGFATWTGPCTSSGGVTMGAAGDRIFVNCPLFEVKGGQLTIPGGGTIIFAGRVAVDAGGTLAVNVASSGSVDAGGYPVAQGSTRQTTIVIGSTASDALSMQSSSSAVVMAQTTIFSRGGVTIQGAPTMRWTPPTSGLTRALLYWSESTQAVHLQGGPTIRARGVFFHGNGPMTAAGNGTIDLTNVQVWADTVRISTGTPSLLMAPDPDNAINVSSSGSQLIR